MWGVTAEALHFVVDEPSKTAEARRKARELAGRVGLSSTGAEQAGIVVTEACTNLLKHAREGELVLSARSEIEESGPMLEMLALDRGPGIDHLGRSLTDGYSTTNTAGTGLGAVTRLSKQSDFYSVVGQGTAILARWWPEASGRGYSSSEDVRVGGVSLPKPGQDVCGDAWGCVQSSDHVTILVADGLGHGMEARLASSQAVRILRENPSLEPGDLLELCHSALRSTRGAAVAAANIDTLRRTIRFAGVGNISARTYGPSGSSQHLVSVNGTAGHQHERLREFCYPWPLNGMLQLHSDGLATGASLDSYPGLAQRDPALIAGVLYRDFARGRDDASVIVAKVA